MHTVLQSLEAKKQKQMRGSLLSLTELPGYSMGTLGNSLPFPQEVHSKWEARVCLELMSDGVSGCSRDLKPNLWGPSLGDVA